MRPDDLIERHGARVPHAPILVTALANPMDAGNAGRLIVDQLLATLPGERVATFDSDMLIDYRSRRPVVTVSDWSIADVEVDDIVIDLLHCDDETPILLLHGPEPDAMWQRFAQAVTDYARDAGVNTVAGMRGIPSTVPHTRDTMVHIHSSKPELVGGQPEQVGQMQLPASANTFLHHTLMVEGMDFVSLIARVPYYLAATDYPRASLAMIARMHDVLNVALPSGNLEVGAQHIGAQLDHIMETNDEIVPMVRALEEQFDEAVAQLGIAEITHTHVFGETVATHEEPRNDQPIDRNALASTIERFLARSDFADPTGSIDDAEYDGAAESADDTDTDEPTDAADAEVTPSASAEPASHPHVQQGESSAPRQRRPRPRHMRGSTPPNA